MMKTYVKPMIIGTEEIAESIYMASGSDCYTVSCYITQIPQEGRGDYRIQCNATHAATDNHHSTEQVLVITFNQPVTYSSSNGTCIAGDGTASISIRYSCHNNASDNIGLGDVVVVSDPGLAISDAYLTCNMTCNQH